jgi:lipopolysaccharide/colanic/teichoic acid biosynthesis glycosyltransferase
MEATKDTEKRTAAMKEKAESKNGRQRGFYEKHIKRPQDFLCASAALLVLSPVMAATALLVRVHLGSPVLFTQE